MSTRRIAKMAGISASAVSMALKGSPRISEATILRVRELAASMGYRPDPKVTALMAHVRAMHEPRPETCFGVVSLYDHPRPWESVWHLAEIYKGMRRRADELGYRLEPIWLREPGMTHRRIRTVLDVRGIQGLLCFGSPDPDDIFPGELDHYAIVTVGLSLRTQLHRVTSHFYNDAIRALNKVHEMGYRRPGLVLGNYEEARCNHIHASAYLGWHERTLPRLKPLPVLRVDNAEGRLFAAWYSRYRPDVVVLVHRHNVLLEFAEWFQRRDVVVPRDVGVIALSDHFDGTGFTGLRQDQALMGACAVELLAGRIISRDFGMPTTPRTELVDSYWIAGGSIRTLSRP